MDPATPLSDRPPPPQVTDSMKEVMRHNISQSSRMTPSSSQVRLGQSRTGSRHAPSPASQMRRYESIVNPMETVQLSQLDDLGGVNEKERLELLDALKAKDKALEVRASQLERKDNMMLKVLKREDFNSKRYRKLLQTAYEKLIHSHNDMLATKDAQFDLEVCLIASERSKIDRSHIVRASRATEETDASVALRQCVRDNELLARHNEILKGRLTEMKIDVETLTNSASDSITRLVSSANKASETGMLIVQNLFSSSIVHVRRSLQAARSEALKIAPQAMQEVRSFSNNIISEFRRLEADANKGGAGSDMGPRDRLVLEKLEKKANQIFTFLNEHLSLFFGAHEVANLLQELRGIGAPRRASKFAQSVNLRRSNLQGVLRIFTSLHECLFHLLGPGHRQVVGEDYPEYPTDREAEGTIKQVPPIGYDVAEMLRESLKEREDQLEQAKLDAARQVEEAIAETKLVMQGSISRLNAQVDDLRAEAASLAARLESAQQQLKKGAHAATMVHAQRDSEKLKVAAEALSTVDTRVAEAVKQVTTAAPVDPRQAVWDLIAEEEFSRIALETEMELVFTHVWNALLLDHNRILRKVLFLDEWRARNGQGLDVGTVNNIVSEMIDSHNQLREIQRAAQQLVNKDPSVVVAPPPPPPPPPPPVAAPVAETAGGVLNEQVQSPADPPKDEVVDEKTFVQAVASVLNLTPGAPVPELDALDGQISPEDDKKPTTKEAKKMEERQQLVATNKAIKKEVQQLNIHNKLLAAQIDKIKSDAQDAKASLVHSECMTDYVIITEDGPVIQHTHRGCNTDRQVVSHRSVQAGDMEAVEMLEEMNASLLEDMADLKRQLRNERGDMGQHFDKLETELQATKDELALSRALLDVPKVEQSTETTRFEFDVACIQAQPGIIEREAQTDVRGAANWHEASKSFKSVPSFLTGTQDEETEVEEGREHPATQEQEGEEAEARVPTPAPPVESAEAETQWEEQEQDHSAAAPFVEFVETPFTELQRDPFAASSSTRQADLVQLLQADLTEAQERVSLLEQSLEDSGREIPSESPPASPLGGSTTSPTNKKGKMGRKKSLGSSGKRKGGKRQSMVVFDVPSSEEEKDENGDTLKQSNLQHEQTLFMNELDNRIVSLEDERDKLKRQLEFVKPTSDAAVMACPEFDDGESQTQVDTEYPHSKETQTRGVSKRERLVQTDTKELAEAETDCTVAMGEASAQCGVDVADVQVGSEGLPTSELGVGTEQLDLAEAGVQCDPPTIEVPAAQVTSPTKRKGPNKFPTASPPIPFGEGESSSPPVQVQTRELGVQVRLEPTPEIEGVSKENHQGPSLQSTSVQTEEIIASSTAPLALSQSGVVPATTPTADVQTNTGSPELADAHVDAIPAAADFGVQCVLVITKEGSAPSAQASLRKPTMMVGQRRGKFDQPSTPPQILEESLKEGSSSTPPESAEGDRHAGEAVGSESRRSSSSEPTPSALGSSARPVLATRSSQTEPVVVAAPALTAAPTSLGSDDTGTDLPQLSGPGSTTSSKGSPTPQQSASIQDESSTRSVPVVQALEGCSPATLRRDDSTQTVPGHFVAEEDTESVGSVGSTPAASAHAPASHAASTIPLASIATESGSQSQTSAIGHTGTLPDEQPQETGPVSVSAAPGSVLVPPSGTQPFVSVVPPVETCERGVQWESVPTTGSTSNDVNPETGSSSGRRRQDEDMIVVQQKEEGDPLRHQEAPLVEVTPTLRATLVSREVHACVVSKSTTTQTVSDKPKPVVRKVVRPVQQKIGAPTPAGATGPDAVEAVPELVVSPSGTETNTTNPTATSLQPEDETPEGPELEGNDSADITVIDVCDQAVQVSILVSPTIVVAPTAATISLSSPLLSTTTSARSTVSVMTDFTGAQLDSKVEELELALSKQSSRTTSPTPLALPARGGPSPALLAGSPRLTPPKSSRELVDDSTLIISLKDTVHSLRAEITLLTGKNRGLQKMAAEPLKIQNQLTEVETQASDLKAKLKTARQSLRDLEESSSSQQLAAATTINALEQTVATQAEEALKEKRVSDKTKEESRLKIDTLTSNLAATETDRAQAKKLASQLGVAKTQIEATLLTTEAELKEVQAKAAELEAKLADSLDLHRQDKEKHAQDSKAARDQFHHALTKLTTEMAHVQVELQRKQEQVIVLESGVSSHVAMFSDHSGKDEVRLLTLELANAKTEWELCQQQLQQVKGSGQKGSVAKHSEPAAELVETKKELMATGMELAREQRRCKETEQRSSAALQQGTENFVRVAKERDQLKATVRALEGHMEVVPQEKKSKYGECSKADLIEMLWTVSHEDADRGADTRAQSSAENEQSSQADKKKIGALMERQLDLTAKVSQLETELQDSRNQAGEMSLDQVLATIEEKAKTTYGDEQKKWDSVFAAFESRQEQEILYHGPPAPVQPETDPDKPNDFKMPQVQTTNLNEKIQKAAGAWLNSAYGRSLSAFDGLEPPSQGAHQLYHGVEYTKKLTTLGAVNFDQHTTWNFEVSNVHHSFHSKPGGVFVPLVYACFCAMKSFNVELSINFPKLLQFLKKIHSVNNEALAYTNSQRAAMAVHTAMLFSSHAPSPVCSPVELLAVFIVLATSTLGAIGGGGEHPARQDVYTIFPNAAPQQHLQLGVVKKLLAQDETNFTDDMRVSDVQIFRALFDRLCLDALDPQKHRTVFNNAGRDGSHTAGRLHRLVAITHLLATPHYCRAKSSFCATSANQITELWLQGDLERRMGREVAVPCDRMKPGGVSAGMQLFAQLAIKPLADKLAHLLPKTMYDRICANVKLWESADQLLPDRRGAPTAGGAWTNDNWPTRGPHAAVRLLFQNTQKSREVQTVPEKSGFGGLTSKNAGALSPVQLLKEIRDRSPPRLASPPRQNSAPNRGPLPALKEALTAGDLEQRASELETRLGEQEKVASLFRAQNRGLQKQLEEKQNAETLMQGIQSVESKGRERHSQHPKPHWATREAELSISPHPQRGKGGKLAPGPGQSLPAGNLAPLPSWAEEKPKAVLTKRGHPKDRSKGGMTMKDVFGDL